MKPFPVGNETVRTRGWRAGDSGLEAAWGGRALIGVAAFPWLALAGFYAFVLRARWHLGQWPYYSHPDPKDLDWSIHYHLALLGPILSPAIALFGIGLVVALRRGTANFPVWRWLTAVAGSCLFLVVLARLDPGGFFEWIAD